MVSVRTNAVSFCLLATFIAACPLGAYGQAVKGTSSKKATKAHGFDLRTEFGHPKRMEDLKSAVLEIFAKCVKNGKLDGLPEAINAYLQQVESELGDAKRRDMTFSDLSKQLPAIARDKSRSENFLEAYRRQDFANTLRARGLHRGAVDHLKQANRSLLKAVPQDSITAISSANRLAVVLAEFGESTESNELAQSAVARARASYTERDEILAESLVALGKVERLTGQPDLAEDALRKGLAIYSTVPEVDPYEYTQGCCALAEVLIVQSKFKEAAELMEHVVPQVISIAPEQPDSDSYWATTLHGRALIGQKRYQEADAVMEHFAAVAQSIIKSNPVDIYLLRAYVMLLDRTDREEQAAPMKRRIARFDSTFENPIPPGLRAFYETLVK